MNDINSDEVVRFEPRQLSRVQAEVWQALVASRRTLSVSALGKIWKFQFVLENSLPPNLITAGIRLGGHLGTIQCGFLPRGRWLGDLLRGGEIEALQEPFRTAVVGVFLEDFFHGLSQSSQLTLRLVDPPSSTPAVPLTTQTPTLHWQMLNDHEEAEIVGSLVADEEMISEICTAASQWPASPWQLPDSFLVSVNVLIGSLALSKKESSTLEVGDTLLLGNIEEWRKDHLLLRLNERKGKESLITLKFTRSILEDTLFSKGNLKLAQVQGLPKKSKKEKNITKAEQSPLKNMPETPPQENQEPSSEHATWTSSKEGEATRWMDAIEVVLEFSLGTQTITLADLKHLGAGKRFSLKAPPDRLVSILVQGQKIGSGELVKVGESEVGILITDLEDKSYQKVVENKSREEENVQPPPA